MQIQPPERLPERLQDKFHQPLKILQDKQLLTTKITQKNSFQSVWKNQVKKTGYLMLLIN